MVDFKIDVRELKISPKVPLMIVSGGTNVGKTFRVKEMILNDDVYFTEKFEKIIFVSNEYTGLENQPLYQELRDKLPAEKILFVQGFSKNFFEENNLTKRTASDKPMLLVLDDVISDVVKHDVKIFQVYCHHFGIFCILIVQNLILDNAIYRQISRQAEYYIIFQSLRGKASLKALSGQIWNCQKFLQWALDDVTKTDQYGCLLLDLRNGGFRDHYRVRTLFDGSAKCVAYTVNEHHSP